MNRTYALSGILTKKLQPEGLSISNNDTKSTSKGTAEAVLF